MLLSLTFAAYVQPIFTVLWIMENLLLLIDLMRLRSCLKAQECGCGKIYFQDFLPVEDLFKDFLCKFQDRILCTKWDSFFFPYS